MPAWPHFASIAFICCSFCSISLCGRHLSDSKFQLCELFSPSPSDKLFLNLVAQFVGLAMQDLVGMRRILLARGTLTLMNRWC
jgi:hypothetical protein